VEIAKSAGFNSPQLAALGKKLSFIDTPRLAAGKFIGFETLLSGGRSNRDRFKTTTTQDTLGI
jgi:hypothetical protein